MGNQTDEITISRARIDSIQTYEVMEHELQLIESSSPSDLFLNGSIALISTGVTCLVTVLTVPFNENQAIQNGFIIATFVSFIVGIVLFLLWLQLKSDRSIIYGNIRARKSTQAVREEIAETVSLSTSEKINKDKETNES